LFQIGFILKIALLEGPALFGIIAFSVDGNLSFLIIAGVLLFIITLQKPTKVNIEAVLNLSNEQRSIYNTAHKKLK